MTRLEIEQEANESLRKLNKELLEALLGIIKIGKRDMSNPKYDTYFNSARAVLRKHGYNYPDQETKGYIRPKVE